MAATGTAADAGLVADLATKLNTSLGGKAKTSDLAAKLDKPAGETGQLVYNATTDAWEAASESGGAGASTDTAPAITILGTPAQ